MDQQKREKATTDTTADTGTGTGTAPGSGLRPACLAALAMAAPIMAGYLVLGIPCGILAVSAGMNAWMTGLLSLCLYSGAGQFMISNMLLAGSPPAAIVASVGLISTRQMLYSASMSSYTGSKKGFLFCLFGLSLTDESFGVNYARFAVGTWDLRRATALNLMCMASWALATVAGALLGEALSVPTDLASFAMTSLFICLLVMQTTNRPALMAACLSALTVVGCKLAGLDSAAIVTGAVAGVVLTLLITGFASKGGAPATAPAGTPARIAVTSSSSLDTAHKPAAADATAADRAGEADI